MGAENGPNRCSAVDNHDFVLRSGGRETGVELRIDERKLIPVPRHGGWHLEVWTCDSALHCSRTQVRTEPDNSDLVAEVLDGKEPVCLEQDSIDVRDAHARN